MVIKITNRGALPGGLIGAMLAIMAGLIPQTFIDDLLRRVNIVEVIGRRLRLKKSGRNYQACCPFHNEKTPSFSVEPERQFYYCFGCGAGGNAIGFVMNFEQLDFPAAVESLARDAGLEVPRQESRAASRRQAQNRRLLDCLEQARQYYRQQLLQHPTSAGASRYLKSRGLSKDIIQHFELGFAPPGWDNLIKAIGKDDESLRALQGAGLIIDRNRRGQQTDNDGKDRPTGFYDRFHLRIMFPIRDSRGHTVGFGGRLLGEGEPKYLNSPETPVFHKREELYGLYEARRSRQKLVRLLVVEGYMDVIALAQMGVSNAVATLGTATSDRHLARLFATVAEIVFCFDGDEAGRKAAWRALETTLPHMEDGRQARFLFLPEGSDPDSYIRQVGREKFLQAVEQAQPLEQFLFAGLSRELDTDSMEGKARLSSLAKPLIQRLPKGIYAQLVTDRLGQILGVDRAYLQQLLASQPERSPEPAPPQVDTRRGSRKPDAASTHYHKPAELKAIELLLWTPEVALSLQRDLQPLQSTGDNRLRLLLELIEKVRKDPQVETYTLLGACYAASQLRGELTQLIKGEKITPPDGVEAEFKQLIDNILSDIERKLRVLRLREEVNSQIAAANRGKRGSTSPV